MKYYWSLLASLPPLPDELGSPLSMTGREVLRRAREEGGEAETLVAALLGEGDVRNLEALNAGFKTPDEGLREPDSALEASLDDALSEELIALPEEADGLDRRWFAWRRWAKGVAAAAGSTLVPDWLDWDLGCRLALAGKDGAPWWLDSVPVLAEHRDLVRAYRDARDPLEAEALRDRTRLAAVRRMAPHYSFVADEVAAYVIQLRILSRWQSLSDEAGQLVLREVFEA